MKSLINLPHTKMAQELIKVSHDKLGREDDITIEHIPAPTIGHDFSSLIGIICTTSKNSLCDDIKKIMCECMVVGYKQAQQDMRKMLGISE
jgi:hypothetical protein